MKSKWILILVILVSLNIIGCEKDTDYIEHKSNGKIVSRQLTIDDFTGIVADAKSTVVLKDGPSQKVTVRVSENIVDDISLQVVNGVWTIDFKDDNIATLNKHEFTVEIESPILNSIVMENSGNLLTEGQLNRASLRVSHNSSGRTQLNCRVNNLNVVMDGSGKFIVNGEAENVEIVHDSSGELNAFGLNSEVCKISHDGSGDAKLLVNTKLTSRIEGSGNIYLKGNPAIENTDNGGGNLIRIN